MKKQDLLDILSQALPAAEDKSIEPELLKERVTRLLDKAFGNNNAYSKRMQEAEAVTKMSVEELYPKKELDIPQTILRFRHIIESLIDEIKLVEPEELGNTTAGGETADKLQQSLDDHLTGSQIKRIREIVTKHSGSEMKRLLSEELDDWDIEVLRNIIADIIISPELWTEKT